MADVAVLHGYTLGDLDALSLQAAGTTWASMGWSPSERREIAWSAIAEALVVAVEAPTRGVLIQAGRRGIYRGIRDHMHHHGVERRDLLKGLGSMGAFATYWWWASRRWSGSPEGRVVERVALIQIWPHLTDRDRQALVALAVHETYQAAAAALGIDYRRFVERISYARRRFRRLWFWPDADPGCWGTDRRVMNGGQRPVVGKEARRAADRRRRRNSPELPPESAMD